MPIQIPWSQSVVVNLWMHHGCWWYVCSYNDTNFKGFSLWCHMDFFLSTRVGGPKLGYLIHCSISHINFVEEEALWDACYMPMIYLCYDHRNVTYVWNLCDNKCPMLCEVRMDLHSENALPFLPLMFKFHHCDSKWEIVESKR